MVPKTLTTDITSTDYRDKHSLSFLLFGTCDNIEIRIGTTVAVLALLKNKRISTSMKKIISKGATAIVTALITVLFFCSSAIAISKDQGGFSFEVAKDIRKGAEQLVTAGNWDSAEALESAAKHCVRRMNTEMYEGKRICGVEVCEALNNLYLEATDEMGRKNGKMDVDQLASWQLLFDPSPTGYSSQCGTADFGNGPTWGSD